MTKVDEKNMVVEEVVEVENCGIEETIDGEEIVVKDSKIKKLIGSVKAGAKKHKKKLIGGALAAGALTIGVIKLVGSHHEEGDDGYYDVDDFVDVEAVEVEPVEVAE